MNSLFDKLNLRPNERRLVVGAGLFLFVSLNLVFVRPHFNDRSKTQIELNKSRDTLELYKKEVAKTKEYETKKRELENQGGAIVKQDAQSTVLAETIQMQARVSRVGIAGLRPVTITTTKTNQFYEEKAYVVNFEAGDKELVDFLYMLGSGSSMIRVRNIDLRPDVSGMKLSGSATLVASYQRAAPLTTKTVIAGARPTPSAKPPPPKATAGAVPGAKPQPTTGTPKPALSTPAPLGSGARRGGVTNTTPADTARRGGRGGGRGTNSTSTRQP